jgi:hypothetical protein
VTDISKGKKIRAPSLIKGGKYVIRFWGKTPVFELVEFMGFTADGVEHDKPTRQLKEMLPTDLYMFKLLVDGTKFNGFMQDLFLVDERTKGRITFSMRGGTDEVSATEEVLPPISDAAEAAEEAAAPAVIEEVTEPTGSFAEMDEVAETISAEAEEPDARPLSKLDQFVMRDDAEPEADVADQAPVVAEETEISEVHAADADAEPHNDAPEVDEDDGEEPVFVEPADESPADRKRRMDAAAKRAKRAAAKAALAATSDEQPSA